MIARRLAFAAFLVAFYAAPSLAAGASRGPLLIQPARVDFDHDGLPDTAAALATKPNIVRVSLSRTGVRDITQPALVLAIAAFDYDRAGDLDLLVATSMG